MNGHVERDQTLAAATLPKPPESPPPPPPELQAPPPPPDEFPPPPPPAALTDHPPPPPLQAKRKPKQGWASSTYKQPLSVEEILRKKKEADEAASKVRLPPPFANTSPVYEAFSSTDQHTDSIYDPLAQVLDQSATGKVSIGETSQGGTRRKAKERKQRLNIKGFEWSQRNHGSCCAKWGYCVYIGYKECQWLFPPCNTYRPSSFACQRSPHWPCSHAFSPAPPREQRLRHESTTSSALCAQRRSGEQRSKATSCRRNPAKSDTTKIHGR